MREHDWIIRFILWINLLLWLAVLGMVLGSTAAEFRPLTIIAITGVAFAAVAQHAGYTRAAGTKSFRLFAPRLRRPTKSSWPERDMKERLAELLRRKPFAPFKIVLICGQAIEITDLNLVAMGESLMHVFRAHSDRYATLRINQVASTEVLEPAG